MDPAHPIVRGVEIPWTTRPVPGHFLGQGSPCHPEPYGEAMEGFDVDAVPASRERSWGTVLVNDDGTFREVPGFDAVVEGVSSKAPGSLGVACEGRFVYWGYTGDPTEMTPAGRALFANAVRHAHERRNRLTVPHRCNPRGILRNLVTISRQMPDYEPRAVGHFLGYVASIPDLAGREWTADSIAAWLDENEPYLRNLGKPAAGGRYEQFVLDEEARRLGTPNRSLDSLARWVVLASGPDGPDCSAASGCLERYVPERIRPADGDWNAWWERMRERLVFVDTAGSVFLEDPRILEREPGPHSVEVRAHPSGNAILVGNPSRFPFRLVAVHAGDRRIDVGLPLDPGGLLSVPLDGAGIDAIRATLEGSDGAAFVVGSEG